MKGQIQLQTIVYVIFAVLFVLVGTFSIQMFLTNLTVDKIENFANMDSAIIAKKITESQDCFSTSQEVIFPAKEDNPSYSIFYVDAGLLEKSLLTNERIDSCFYGYSKKNLRVSIFSLSEDHIKTQIISWGGCKDITDGVCDPWAADARADKEYDLILRIKDGDSITPGFAEVRFNK
jgi:hypothetical protein